MSIKPRPLKWYARLQQGKYRRAEGVFLAEGARVVRQLIDAGCVPEEILYTEGAGDIPLLQECGRNLSQSQMSKIATTATPPRVMAVFSAGSTYTATLPETPGNRILYMEDVQDPGNVGTLIRSAAAFGFSGVILTDGGADPLSTKVVRSAAGALGSLWIRRSSHTQEQIETLRRGGYHHVVLDFHGEAAPSLQTPCVVSVGNEGQGVSPGLRKSADTVYTIPYESDRVESLNAAVATSILMNKLYEL
ncbi:TrmH family RNA methyltransferase [Chitinivibrio alkaliphilus]|uniref:SpoU rRNA methylase n=1 Tax=Chitinivibrio alkaliphilus ACht1 TaxID=1313304 RepID=U7DC45_9BACT|nr:RNA methyltransferase [Chitinivibrio alkaliphilus]ERP39153.1 SpoU rRNA methylase [Chitinivibrio alkaliphilus ACht1]